MNKRRNCFKARIARITMILIVLTFLGRTSGVCAEEVNVESFLKQMSQATARTKDFECTLESVYNRKGVSETVVARVIFKRPDKYSITYLAPAAYEGTKVLLSKGTGVVVNKDGTWKAYDSLTVQGLETLNFMLKFARDNIEQTYDVKFSDKANIEDRVAYVLVAEDRQNTAKEPEVFWIDNVKFLILQAETSDILGERTLLKLKKVNPGNERNWDNYILTVFDLKGDIRGEITVTQVERGLYLPTKVNLLTEFGTVDQVIKDIKVNTGVTDKDFILQEAEDMRAKLKEAESAYSKKNYDKALKAYEQVIKLDPDNIEARCNLGLCYWLTDDIDKAINTLEAVIARAPGFLPAYNNLGFILADEERDINRGITLIETAANRDPANPVYMDSLGWAYFKLGNFDEAERTIRRALLFDSLFPDKGALATAHYHLAMVYEAMGKKAEAISAIQQALEVEPFNSKFRNELARLRQN
ncbi:MAG TPA: tetratricopeptide repeat protein [Bacillota bacterium]|nr:tetratricopeptide repeat protein [Bacillota bacterium]